jgi:ParB/RepB/Spo0J family partition protein
MQQAKRIESIGISKLIAHPANPNRMSGSAFSKLTAHIERTGNYEPVIVRPHQQRTGCYEIINGHHRVRALRKLGSETCDCIVWQVDDAETLVLLGTLNRLSGHDVLEKKAELIKSLSERFSTKDLAKRLPDTKRAIERLKNLKVPAKPAAGEHKTFLNPLIFFLTDEQKQAVTEAIAAATEAGAKDTTAQRKAKAIVRIARIFLRVNAEEKRL